MKADPLFIVLAGLLVFLPCASLAALGLAGAQILGGRELPIQAVWLYRNLLFLAVYGAVAGQKLRPIQIRDFIRLNIWFGVLLGGLGLVSYSGLINLATFEAVVAGEVPGAVGGPSIGMGFLGMFRGAMGAWFGTLWLLAVGAYSLLPSRFRKVAWLLSVVSAVVVAMSYSRAGLAGLLAGALVLLLVSRRRAAIVRVGAVALAVLCMLFILDIAGTQERFVPTGAVWGDVLGRMDQAASSRIEAWKASFPFFARSPAAFLIGIGPTNRTGVVEATGLYGAHSEYIDVVFRLGLPGLVLLLGALWIGVRRLLRQGRLAGAGNAGFYWTGLAILAANAVIGVPQTHLLHDHATYSWGFYLYLLYGLFLGKWAGCSMCGPRTCGECPNDTKETK